MKSKLTELKDVGLVSSAKRLNTSKHGLHSPVCSTPNTVRKGNLLNDAIGFSTLTNGNHCRHKLGVKSCNWQVEDAEEEPLPRSKSIARDGSAHSSRKKRKASKERLRNKVKEHADMEKDKSKKNRKWKHQ